ncbi:MAG: TniQ family protein, partial [Blastocatellia bacterium]
MSRLLRTPRPIADESLKGYILRLTEDNHYDSPSWILDLAGLKPMTLRQSWSRLRRRKAIFTGLSELAGITEGEAAALGWWTERSDEHAVPEEVIEFTESKFCARCLAERNYWRKAWDLLLVTACLDHSALLLDRCPGCGQPIHWNRKRVRVCRCGFDWCGAAMTAVDEPGLRATRYIMKALGPEAIASPSVGETSPLECLFIDELCDVLFCVGDALGAIEFDRRLRDMTRNEPCHQVLERTIKVVEDWPHFCFDLFDKVKRERHIGAALIESAAMLSSRGVAFLYVALQEYSQELEASDSPLEFRVDRRFVPVDVARRKLVLTSNGFDRLLA